MAHAVGSERAACPRGRLDEPRRRPARAPRALARRWTRSISWRPACGSGACSHLVVVASPDGDRPWPALLLRRFSALSLAAVRLLMRLGRRPGALLHRQLARLLGTGYGLMVMTKMVMLGGLIVLGAIELLRRPEPVDDASGIAPLRLRRFVEVELGLGLTVLFAAASLTSLPPAVDVVADRATLAEVGRAIHATVAQLLVAAPRGAPRGGTARRPGRTRTARGPSTTTTWPACSSSPWASWPSCIAWACAGPATGLSSSS